MSTTTVVAPPRPLIIGASQVGPSHVRRGESCQDAFDHAVMGDGATIVAVSDGLGSVKHGGIGATTASAAAVRAASAMLHAAPDAPLPRVAEHAVACARLAVRREALARASAPRDLACTLMVVLLTPRGTCAAHIGDGAVIIEGPSGLAVLSDPGDGEYVEVTDPLTADDWQQRLRVSPVVEDVRAAIALTDGCQRAALTPSGAPGAGFVEPLLAFARGAQDPDAARASLEGLLAGPKMNEHSDDDKTLVVAVLDA